MSDICITAGLFKIIFALIFYIAGICMALNRSDVEFYIQSIKTYSELDENYSQWVAQDYVYVTSMFILMGSMRLWGGLTIIVGEYSEQAAIKITGLIGYTIDVVLLMVSPIFLVDRCVKSFKDHLNMATSIFGGVEIVILLALIVALVFSLHESKFKAKWEQLKEKRRKKKEKKKADKAAKLAAQK